MFRIVGQIEFEAPISMEAVSADEFEAVRGSLTDLFDSLARPAGIAACIARGTSRAALAPPPVQQLAADLTVLSAELLHCSRDLQQQLAASR